LVERFMGEAAVLMIAGTPMAADLRADKINAFAR
jgi:hypothetical protein